MYKPNPEVQRLIDVVVPKIRAQGGPSLAFNVDGDWLPPDRVETKGKVLAPVRCAYRSGDRRCAIGHAIIDEAYAPSMEGKLCRRNEIVNAIISSGYKLDPKSDDLAWESIVRIQQCHDANARGLLGEPITDAQFLLLFENSMANFAELFGYTIPPA